MGADGDRGPEVSQRKDVLVLSDAVECSFMFGHLLIVNKLIVNKLPLSKTLHAVHIEEEEEEEGRDMLRFHLFFLTSAHSIYTHTRCISRGSG